MSTTRRRPPSLRSAVRRRVLRLAALLCISGLAGTSATAQEVAPLESANHNLRLELRERDGGVDVEAHNLRPVALELEIASRLGHAAPTESRILAPRSTTTLFRLERTSRESAQDWLRSRYRLRYWMGDPARIEPDLQHLYRLPFRAGRRYRLSQGFDGGQSHRSEASRYALDFQLEVGEPVHAARAGRVVRAVDHFRQVVDQSRVNEVNLVVVEHDDGTLAHYVHLHPDSVTVREGEPVTRGQHLADVGLTGFTHGPHLHFVVRRERDRAIPIRFEGYAERDLSRGGRFRVPADSTHDGE